MEDLSTDTAAAAVTAREWCWWVLFRLSLSSPIWGSTTKDTITSAVDFSFNLLYFAIEGVGLFLAGLIFWCFPGGHAWGKYCWEHRYSSSTIPGSRGFPFVGSIMLMSGLAHRHLAKEARRLKAERLMAFSVGESRIVVTSHPDVAKEILNSSAFVDRQAKESAYRLMFHRSIGFAPYGVYWRTLRKITAGHLFSPKQITACQPLRSEIASEMVSEIRKKNKNKEVCVRDVLKPAALNNIMWMVFGRRYVIGSNEKKQELEELHELLQEGYDLLGKLDWSDHLPILSSFDLQGIRCRCNALVPKVYHFVDRIVREQRETTDDGNLQSESFIDVLFSLQKRENNLSNDDINAILWEMVFRGTDTVAVLMEWAMARMVLHPDIQEKAQEELDRVVGRSRAVAGTDMNSLVYIQAVVKETLRLHPPGPLLSWARLSTCDTTIDGHHVPAGTTGMVNMWAITHDRQVWDQPLLFRPERFLHAGQHEIISVMGSDLRLAPFGSGRRSCPGKALGMSTVEFWIATLLHEYKWLPAATLDLSENLILTCEMENPLLVNVRPRN